MKKKILLAEEQLTGADDTSSTRAHGSSTAGANGTPKATADGPTLDESARILFDSLPLMAWMSDASGTRIHFNGSWLRFTGSELHSELDGGWMRHVHPGDAESLVRAITALSDRQGEFSAEYRLRCSDGEYVWVLDRAQPRYGPDASFLGYTGACTDISCRKRAEALLLETRKSLGSLENASPAVIYIGDPNDFRIEFISDNVSNLLGYSYSEFLANPTFLLERIHPDDRQAVAACVPVLLKQGYVIHEHRMLHSDGSYRWIRDEVRLLRSESGETSRASGVLTDVTERRVAGQELRLLNDRLEQLVADRTKAAEQRAAELSGLRASTELILESAGEGIIGLDDERRVTFVNPAALRLLNATRDQLLGNVICSTHCVFKEHSDACPIRDSLYNGVTHRESHQVFWRTDGTSLPVEFVSAPVREDGKLAGVVVVFNDITQRKRVEQELRESERSYRELADMLPQTVFECDEFGNITFGNKAAYEIFGYSEQDFVSGLSVLQMVVPEDRPKALANFQIRLSGVAGNGTEYMGITKHGRTLPVVVYMSPTQGRKGARGIVADVSVLKQTEERLRKTIDELARSNSELEHFAYVASHDLQEPLRMVVLFMQMLKMRYQGQLDAEADEYINYAVGGATQMKVLVDDLLAYSRLRTQGKPLKETCCAKALAQAVANLSVMAEEAGAVVTNESLPVVMGDPGQLVQLFQNLLSNAMKFRGSESPRVHVSAVREQSHWVISIRDNGIGIESEYRERIFNIFERLHARSEFAGSGIGLTICTKIVERHGGRIWVESEPGKGSTFRFTIPDHTHQNGALDAQGANLAR